ncbi:MAG: carotenoid 1,2-hydratase [Candidatus Tectimicrobiota bacterium]|nr:MAG: carotenoid 1,2-hydratase [Candidatus Tectomicrobia bacterium]
MNKSFWFLVGSLVGVALWLAAGEGALLGFQQAVPGYRWEFPRDHGAHPGFQTEWWYYTGHLHAAPGRTFGYQLTFFRHRLDRPGLSLNPSQWFADQLYLAHMAITDEARQRFVYGEKRNRAALGVAGAAEGRYHVWNEDWLAQRLGRHHFLQGAIPGYELRLVLTPLKPLVLHGEGGLSRKGAGKGQASYYYSFTRLYTEGVLRTEEGVFDVSGLSWMDHEFGSTQLSEEQVGWDWFSVQLDNHHELMLYHIRRRDGSLDAASSGTLVRPDGSAVPLRRDDFRVEAHERWRSPKSGAVYPQRWTLYVPRFDVVLHLEPVLAEQELITDSSTLITYWEGRVRVRGRFQGQETQGAGYVELTGYAHPVRL